MRYCLTEGGITHKDINLVAFYDKPFLKFDRLLSTYQSFAPQGFPLFLKVMPLWLKQKLHLKAMLQPSWTITGRCCSRSIAEGRPRRRSSPRLSRKPPSSRSTAWANGPPPRGASGKDNKITILGEMNFPHSIGLLYAAFTYYTASRSTPVSTR